MLSWLALLLLIAAEAGGIYWYLRKEYYRVMFNGWAALIYSAILTVDFVAAWLVSMFFTPGGSSGIAWLMTFGAVLVVVIALMTFFFRWVVKHDMNDIPK